MIKPALAKELFVVLASESVIYVVVIGGFEVFEVVAFFSVVVLS